MRKIIIPTDFTPDSLQLIEYAVLNHPNTRLDIVLLVGYRIPENRWSIVHFRKQNEIQNQLSEPFKQAYSRVVLEYKDIINSITFEMFNGINSFSFKNFIEGIGAEHAVIPKNKSLYLSGNKWFDTTKYIRKEVANVIEAPVLLGNDMPQGKVSLAGLFTS